MAHPNDAETDARESSGLTVAEAIEKLEQCDPDKEIRVDPPYSPARSIFERDECVEVKH